MLFPTKQKVHGKLLELTTRSVRVSLAIKKLQDDMSEFDALLGPMPEVQSFATEMDDTAQGLSLFMVMLQQDRVRPRVVDKKLSEFEHYIAQCERKIAAVRLSYDAGRLTGK